MVWQSIPVSLFQQSSTLENPIALYLVSISDTQERCKNSTSCPYRFLGIENSGWNKRLNVAWPFVNKYFSLTWFWSCGMPHVILHLLLRELKDNKFPGVVTTSICAVTLSLESQDVFTVIFIVFKLEIKRESVLLVSSHLARVMSWDFITYRARDTAEHEHGYFRQN